MSAIIVIRCCSLICCEALSQLQGRHDSGTVLSSNSTVIAARPFTIPYLTALLPSELEMQQMEETDSSEQDEQTDTENIPLHISTVGPAFCLLQSSPQTSPHCPQPVTLGPGHDLPQVSAFMLGTCKMGS